MFNFFEYKNWVTFLKVTQFALVIITKSNPSIRHNQKSKLISFCHSTMSILNSRLELTQEKQ
jgi:hypothetical protein